MLYAWVENGLIFATDNFNNIPEQYKDSYVVIDDVPIHLISHYYYVENNQIKKRDIIQLLQKFRKEKLAELNQKYYDIVHRYLELNIENLSIKELTELDKKLRLQYKQLKDKILNSNDISELITLNIDFKLE